MAAAAQPCTVGDMQMYVGEQAREIKTYVDGQNRDMRAYIDGLDFLTVARANEHMAAHMRDQRYITAAELRSLGYAPTSDVKDDLLAIVKHESELVASLKLEMQQLFDQTRSLQTGFEQQAKDAITNIESIQTQMMTTFEQRSEQLQDHVNASNVANIASLDLFKSQLGDYTNTKQSELLKHCEGRLHQLYDTVIKDAETKLEQRIGQIQATGGLGSDVSFGKGAPRERALFDPRDYKIPNWSPTRAWPCSRNGSMMSSFSLRPLALLGRAFRASCASPAT